MKSSNGATRLILIGLLIGASPVIAPAAADGVAGQTAQRRPTETASQRSMRVKRLIIAEEGLMGTDQFAQRLQYWEEARRTDPNHPALYGRWFLHVPGPQALADLNGILKTLPGGNELYPARDHLLAIRADVHRQMKQYDKARADCEAALAVNADSAAAEVQLGLLAVAERNPEQALQHLDRAIQLSGYPIHEVLEGYQKVTRELSPALAAGYESLASWHLLDNDPDLASRDAEIALQRCIEHGGASAPVLLRYGQVLGARWEYEESIAALEQSLRLAKSPEAYLAQARSFIGVRRVDEAVRACDAAIEMDPKNHEGYRQRALTRAKLPDGRRQAVEDVKRVEELAGGKNAVTAYLRGQVLAEMGEHEHAINSLTAASVLDPMAIEPHLARARSLIELKRYMEAARACDDAIAINDLEYRAYNHRAFALLQLPDERLRRQARNDLERVLESRRGTFSQAEYLAQAEYLMTLCLLDDARRAPDGKERVQLLGKAESAINRANEASPYVDSRIRTAHHQIVGQLWYATRRAGLHSNRLDPADRHDDLIPFGETATWGEIRKRTSPPLDGPAPASAAVAPAPAPFSPVPAAAVKADDDDSGMYILMAIGAAILANELLDDDAAAPAKAPAAGEKPRLKRTVDCGECGGTGDAMMEGHGTIFVPAPKIYLGPCDVCDGTGKVVHWMDKLLE